MHDFKHCLGDFILIVIFCIPFLYSINRRGIPPMKEHLGECKYLGSINNKVLVLL
ncbi:hypothetical protein GIB67_018700, partial [Kingdonia uniflora]